MTERVRRRVGSRSAAPVQAPRIQTKLMVGPAGDRHEREADAIADRVVAALRRPVGALPGRAGHGRARRMAGPRTSREVPQASKVQRLGRIGADGGDVDPHTESEIRTAQRGGAPLPDGVRSALEPAFGADFGSVRIHVGAQASALNERIQAQAFTTGNHVFFRDGLPDISQRAGQHLLAHELTHTLQQGASGPRAQRAASIQRFLDPSQQAKLSAARGELSVLLKAPKGGGKKAAARKRKLAELRGVIEALETADRTTPDPAAAHGASIAPAPRVGGSEPTTIPEPTVLPPVADAGAVAESESEVDPQVEAGSQTGAQVDPLAGTRAALRADLDAAQQRMVGIRGAATRALRARMPRGYLETSGDIDKIVAGLSRQATFDDYRSRIQALTPDQVGGATSAVAKLVEDFSDRALERRVDWWVGVLDGLTVAQVTKLVDAATDKPGKEALRSYLLRVVGARLEVGPLRKYYRSSHDRDEKATYGMSFDLSNSPLAVHCHTAGSGTQVTSVSVKHRDREGGAPVLSESWLQESLAGKLAEGICRSTQNPQAVVGDIKAGRRPAGNWTRPGLPRS